MRFDYTEPARPTEQMTSSSPIMNAPAGEHSPFRDRLRQAMADPLSYVLLVWAFLLILSWVFMLTADW